MVKKSAILRKKGKTSGLHLGKNQGGNRDYFKMSINQIKVTIITVVRNGEKTLEKTIQSVINQTHKNIEYLIFDGNSQDKTRDIIKKYEKNIAFWQSDNDPGVYHAMNKAIDHVTGQWVLFLNAGDCLFDKDTVARVLSRLPEEGDFVYGNYFCQNKNHYLEYIQAARFDHLWQKLKQKKLNRYWLKSIPCHQTLFVRSEILKKHRFNLKYNIAADHQLMFACFSQGYNFYNTHIPIVVYAQGGFSQKKLIRSLWEKRNIIKRHQPSFIIDLFFGFIIFKAVVEKYFYQNEYLFTRYKQLKSYLLRSFPNKKGDAWPKPLINNPGPSTIISLHIPKAAGTTMLQIIRAQFPKKLILEFNNNDAKKSMEKYKNLEEERKKNLRAVHGHMWFGLHRFTPNPCQYITILREPVERVISHYYYVLNSPKHYLHEKIKAGKMGLEEYSGSKLSTELNNGQTRLLAGDISLEIPAGCCSPELLALAKKNIDQHFILVGLKEEFVKTSLLMNKILGWKISFSSRNINKNRPLTTDIPQKTVDLIRENNRLDIDLYDYARSLFWQKYESIFKTSNG